MLTETVELAADGTAVANASASDALMALPPAERAALALHSPSKQKLFEELATKHANVKDIKDKAGRDQAHGAYMELKNARTALTNDAKAVREDATAFSKAVIAEEARLKKLIEDEEARLMKVRDDWDAAEKKRKAEEAEKERLRLVAINTRIEEIRGYQALVADLRTSERATGLLERLHKKWKEYDLQADFQERLEEAKTAFSVTAEAIERRRDLLANNEAEQKRRDDEQERLNAQKAAQDKREQELRDQAAEVQRKLDALEAAQKAAAAPPPAAEPEKAVDAAIEWPKTEVKWVTPEDFAKDYQLDATQAPVQEVLSTDQDAAAQAAIDAMVPLEDDDTDAFGVSQVSLRQPEEQAKNQQAAEALERVATAQPVQQTTYGGGGGFRRASRVIETPTAERLVGMIATYCMVSRRTAAGWLIERAADIAAMKDAPDA